MSGSERQQYADTLLDRMARLTALRREARAGRFDVLYDDNEALAMMQRLIDRGLYATWRELRDVGLEMAVA